jgi:glucokinase
MDLIGDIGGTSARLALARDGRIIADSLWQDSGGSEDFRAVLDRFRAVSGHGAIRAAAIAGAGALRGARRAAAADQSRDDP